jgi:hypothetical protein
VGALALQAQVGTGLWRCGRGDGGRCMDEETKIALDEVPAEFAHLDAKLEGWTP